MIRSPERSPAASPWPNTCATTFGPDVYMVRQPKSGLLGQRARFTAYSAQSATMTSRKDAYPIQCSRARSRVMPSSLSSRAPQAESEQHERCDRQGLYEYVPVLRIERLSLRERYIPYQCAAHEQIAAIAVANARDDPALRIDECRNPSGCSASHRHAVLDRTENDHRERLVRTRGRSEDALVGHAHHEIGPVQDEAPENVGEIVLPADGGSESPLGDLEKRVAIAGHKALLQGRNPVRPRDQSLERHLLAERRETNLVVLAF